MIFAKKLKNEHQDQGELLPHAHHPCSPYPTTYGVSGSQRADVVNSMTAVACSLQLSDDVLFSAVASLDRCLAAVPVPLALLQPLSITCLWIAAKYESAAASGAVFASLVCDSLNSKYIASVNPLQLLNYLEASILGALDDQLASTDTAKHHLQLIMQKLPTSSTAATPPSIERPQQQKLYCMMSYLAEVGLLENTLLSTPCSQLAAAAFALAHVLLGTQLDTDLLMTITGYSLTQLQTPLQYLCALHTTLVQAFKNGKPYAVSIKYSAPALHAVACVAPLCDAVDVRLGM